MKSFLVGKTTLPLPALSRLHAGSLVLPTASAARPQPVEKGHSPGIEVVKEGDKVVRLVISCGCGERMEVECIYPAGS